MIAPSPNNVNCRKAFTHVDHLCPSCKSKGLSLFYEVRDVPVDSTSIMLTREGALISPLGDIVLGFCGKCGFVTNIAFNPTIQNDSTIYEDQQCFSPTFNAYAHNLADFLIKKYDLHDKAILEIGCGKGDFLKLLCRLGCNRGVGIDPLCEPQRSKGEAANRVIFIQDYYSERYAEYVGDLVCCRHTLEHISNTAEFVKTVRRSIGDHLRTAVLFEVPNTTRILRQLAFWDIYYEHCSYFTAGSLARLFRSCGFGVTGLTTSYDDQYLFLEAKPTKTPAIEGNDAEQSIEQIGQDVQYFRDHVGDKLEKWAHYFQQMHIQGKRAVIWGSGSKCVSFMTSLNIEDQIEFVVDINHYRQWKFLPGSGKEIMEPEVLKRTKPDLVIVMNSIYCEEINKKLHDMGVVTDVITV